MSTVQISIPYRSGLTARGWTGKSLSTVVATVCAAALFAGGSVSVAQADLIANGDFEADPFTTGWTIEAAGTPAVVTDGLNGSAQAALFGSAAPASNGLVQGFTETGENWAFEADFIASDPGSANRSLQLYLNHAPGRRINLYVDDNGAVRAFDRVNGWTSLFDGAPVVVFSTLDGAGAFTSRLEHHLKIVGHGYGTAEASFDVIVTDSNGVVHTDAGLTIWQLADPTTAQWGGLDQVTLKTSAADGGRWVWDNVQVSNVPEPGAAVSLATLGLLLAFKRRGDDRH